MGDPLAGSVAKVQRASLHLETLHRAISPFLEEDPKPYRFVSKVDVETSVYVMRVLVVREPPDEWSLIAGDFIQNLRASLDYLVWQLVRGNGQRPTGSNAFPIFDAKPPRKRSHSERERWNRMLAGVHPAAVNFIQLCQPYNAPDGPSKHLLAVLRKLSNEDKHRRLIPALSAIEGRADRFNLDVAWSRDIRAPLKGGQVFAGRPLKNGDKVLEAPVAITGPNPEVKLNGTLPLDIGFGRKPTPLEGFRQMVHAVASLVARARVYLGH